MQVLFGSAFPEPISVIAVTTVVVSLFAIAVGYRDFRDRKTTWGIVGLLLGALGLGVVLALSPLNGSAGMADIQEGEALN